MLLTYFFVVDIAWEYRTIFTMQGRICKNWMSPLQSYTLIDDPPQLSSLAHLLHQIRSRIAGGVSPGSAHMLDGLPNPSRSCKDGKFRDSLWNNGRVPDCRVLRGRKGGNPLLPSWLEIYSNPLADLVLPSCYRAVHACACLRAWPLGGSIEQQNHKIPISKLRLCVQIVVFGHQFTSILKCVHFS